MLENLSIGIDAKSMCLIEMYKHNSKIIPANIVIKYIIWFSGLPKEFEEDGLDEFWTKIPDHFFSVVPIQSISYAIASYNRILRGNSKKEKCRLLLKTLGYMNREDGLIFTKLITRKFKFS